MDRRPGATYPTHILVKIRQEKNGHWGWLRKFHISCLKVRSHRAATVAAPARKCCHYNWIPLYLMDLFTLCGSGCGTGNDNASKWIPTLFLQLRQWQTYTVVTVICHCHKCSCEHFHFIVAEKPLPLPHRVNGPSNQVFGFANL